MSHSNDARPQTAREHLQTRFDESHPHEATPVSYAPVLGNQRLGPTDPLLPH